MKIKVIMASSQVEFEVKINNFISSKEKEYNITDIKFSTTCIPQGKAIPVMLSALITYESITKGVA